MIVALEVHMTCTCEKRRVPCPHLLADVFFLPVVRYATASRSVPRASAKLVAECAAVGVSIERAGDCLEIETPCGRRFAATGTHYLAESNAAFVRETLAEGLEDCPVDCDCRAE